MDRKQLLRLCHLCGNLNESEASEVLKCLRCGKAFLPVNYFQKMRERAILAGQPLEDMPDFPMNPLNGLLVFW